jgi:hypothetical protein
MLKSMPFYAILKVSLSFKIGCSDKKKRINIETIQVLWDYGIEKEIQGKFQNFRAEVSGR